MKLAVKSYPNCLVQTPGVPKFVNMPGSYVGREFNYETGTYDLKDEPDYFDSDSTAGRKIKRDVQQLALYPADQETADFCGVYFHF